MNPVFLSAESALRTNSRSLIGKISAALGIEIAELTLSEASNACFDRVYRNFTLVRNHKTELDELVNSKGQSLLIASIVKNDEARLSSFIQEKIALHQEGLNGNLPIHYAAERGSLKLFEKINFNPISARNRLGQTPLHLAAYEGNLDIVKYILAHYSSTLTTQSSLWHFGPISLELTPIALAVICGHRDCVKAILDKNKNALSSDCDIGNLLHLCVAFYQNELLALLINEHYDNLTFQMEEVRKGKTPLMLAAEIGNVKALHFLNDKGVNLEATNGKGYTALHFAIEGNQPNAVALLIKMGANCYSPYACPLQLATDLIPKCGAEMQTIVAYLNNARLQNRSILHYSLLPPENLILQGGGPRGAGLLGALEALEQKFSNPFKRVAATSAGAILAPFIALNCPAEKIKEIFFSINLMDLLDYKADPELLNQLINEGTLGKLKATIKGFKYLHHLYHHPEALKKDLNTFYHTTGICEGEFLRQKIEELIYQFTGIPFFTFKDLREGKRKENYKDLYLFATQIDPTIKILEMHSEKTDDGIWDDVPLSDAVRASMSIPYVYKPFRIHIKNREGVRVPHPENILAIDGGLLRNFPRNHFDRKKYTTTNFSPIDQEEHIFNPRSIAISYKEPEIKYPPSTNMTVREFLTRFGQVYYNSEALLMKAHPDSQCRTIEIDPVGVGLSSFNMTHEKKLELIASGKTAVLEFLKKQEDDFLKLVKKQPVEYSTLPIGRVGLKQGLYLFSNGRWDQLPFELNTVIRLNELTLTPDQRHYVSSHGYKIAFTKCNCTIEMHLEDKQVSAPPKVLLNETGKAQIAELSASFTYFKFTLHEEQP